MFVPIMEQRPLLRDFKSDRIGRRATTTIVNCLAEREEYYRSARHPRTAAPIDVLTIHEEVFVEWAYSLHGFASNHPETPYQDLDREHAVMRKQRHVLTVKEAGVLESGR